MKNTKQYYKELGKAVYAIAAADGVISAEENEALHRFVLKQLVSHEIHEDSSRMNEAFYVDFSFEEAREQHADPAGAVRSFIRFVHTNSEPADKDLLERSVNVLKQVAAAYSRKKEKEIVAGIQSELREVFR
jgi:hypothetical protein